MVTLRRQPQARPADSASGELAERAHALAMLVAKPYTGGPICMADRDGTRPTASSSQSIVRLAVTGPCWRRMVPLSVWLWW